MFVRCLVNRMVVVAVLIVCVLMCLHVDLCVAIVLLPSVVVDVSFRLY